VRAGTRGAGAAPPPGRDRAYDFCAPFVSAKPLCGSAT
jgi:hypothetical protein